MLLSALAAPRGVRSAGPLDGDFEIHSAFVVVDHGVLQLNAHIEYPINDRIRGALQDGVTLAFDLDVTISRHRRFWFDATLLETTLRRELTYHAVTNRYVLRDEAGVEQESFPTLEAALDELGRIEDLPILVESQLRGEAPWEVAVRAGVRRGRMPDALRALVFWTDDWHRSTDWYTWMSHAIRRLGVRVLTAAAFAAGIGALLLLARSVENSAQFSRWQPWILLVNICGAIALMVLLTRKFWQLYRDYRDHVPGSRLAMRTVLMFGSLVIAPLLIVYLFSLDFINRGIDSWFRVEIKQGLNDARGAVALGARSAPARAGAPHREPRALAARACRDRRCCSGSTRSGARPTRRRSPCIDAYGRAAAVSSATPLSQQPAPSPPEVALQLAPGAAT